MTQWVVFTSYGFSLAFARSYATMTSQETVCQ